MLNIIKFLLILPTLSLAELVDSSEAMKALESLPRGVLGLDYVIAKAYDSSDSVRAVRAAEGAIEVARWQSLASFSTEIYGSGFYSKNDNSQASIFDPKNVKTFTLGSRRLLPTGTILGLEFSDQQSDLRQGNTFSLPNKSSARIYATQSLIRDVFGVRSRAIMRSGDIESEANRMAYRTSLQSWVRSVVEQYYGAWLAKARLVSAREQWERQKRLLSVTRLKLARGTAERPDLLQIESAALQAESAHKRAEEDLQQLWRELVSNLKLPTNWGDIKASLIPLELDMSFLDAHKLCEQYRKSAQVPELSLEAQEHNLRAEAAKNAALAAKFGTLPELSLEGSYLASGSTSNFSQRRNDAFEAKNPEWNVGLRLSWQLENYASRADRARIAAENIRAEAQASASKEASIVNWINYCSDLENSQSSETLFGQAVAKLRERVQLEERRFGLGRTNTFSVISAGDDLSRTELEHQQSRISLRRKAWEILQMNASIKAYLERVRTRL